MMPLKNKLPLIVRHLCLWSVILFGLMTIMATGSDSTEDDDEDSTEPTPVSYRKTMEKMDSDFDGVTDSVTTYSYDLNGNLNTENHYTGEDDSGTSDEIISYQYDSSGNRTKEMRDINGDGIIDEVSNYSYDENGNLSRIEDDNDNDATTAVDSVTEFTWEEI
jgi:hypothetical protein